MELLPIKPVKSGGNCVDDIFATVSGWLQRDYELMYADCLRFGFDMRNPEETLGKRMQVDFRTYFDLLDRYHGYRIELRTNIAPADCIRLIRQQLSKRQTVALSVDSYFTPWDPNFQQTHLTNHLILVVGLEEETHDLICTDPFFERTDQRLPFALFEQGLARCLTFELTHEGAAADRRELLLKLQGQLADQLASTLTEQSFRDFAQALPEANFAKETEGCSTFGDSPLFAGMGALINARNNYARMLEYAAAAFDLPRLLPLAGRMRQLANDWAVARGLITKMNIMSRSNGHLSLLPAAQQKITANAANERQLLASFLDALQFADEPAQEQTAAAAETASGLAGPASGQAEVESCRADEAVKEIIPLDLTALFNARGIGDDSETADFDSEGYYYSPQGLPDHRELRFEDTVFAFPAMAPSAFDNISCLSQTIDLDERRCQGIMMLGSCEFGSYVDQITVEFSDASQEQVPCGFSDWWSFSPVNGERIAWKTNAARKGQGVLSSEVFLYAKKSRIRGSLPIKRLILPDMPNIHIFAISLWT